ncbi:polyprenyl synthetase family protein [Halobacillus sp. Marseille-P3879]|uniref:polyprenyl synthetase family protein n=1 Tax=Halobacillus sp. Marseille-P3879 TaxID=2045014 RepID=UPI001F338490|nr:farnesyl diphosphate synthase [Halobacillus sp. Marseille-P3879]
MVDSLMVFLKKHKQQITIELEKYIINNTNEGRLRDAMLYSIQAGGKRIRPILLLAVLDSFKQDTKKGISVACALEMIHTYSLIHDDLPAMDNDAVRRGQPTNHKQFDEATAILAGDALLTLSFQIISESKELTSEEKVYLIKELSAASGPKGMVDGQMQDMDSENQTIPLDKLETIHKYKTGALLKFSIMAGAFLAQANNHETIELTRMADALGLLFQIQDDILDVVGDVNTIGKPTGSDEGNHKSTYPQLLGMEGAVNQKNYYAEIAYKSLDHAGVNNTILSELIKYLSQRDR